MQGISAKEGAVWTKGRPGRTQFPSVLLLWAQHTAHTTSGLLWGQEGIACRAALISGL